MIINYNFFHRCNLIHEAGARKLLDLRGLPSAEYDYLPKEGYIGLLHGQPVAIGFLRPIDSRICILDSYITNPEMDSHTRNSALHGITARLVRLAQDEHYIKIIAFSEHKSLIDRICGQGFVRIPMDFAMMNLTKDGDKCHFSEP